MSPILLKIYISRDLRRESEKHQEHSSICSINECSIWYKFYTVAFVLMDFLPFLPKLRMY